MPDKTMRECRWCGGGFIPDHPTRYYCNAEHARVARLESMRETARQRYATNPEAKVECTRRWRAANPKALREQRRRYAAKNAKSLLERGSKRRLKNSTDLRAVRELGIV